MDESVVGSQRRSPKFRSYSFANHFPPLSCLNFILQSSHSYFSSVCLCILLLTYSFDYSLLTIVNPSNFPLSHIRSFVPFFFSLIRTPMPFFFALFSTIVTVSVVLIPFFFALFRTIIHE